MMTLHQPVRAYVMDEDAREAYDTVLLDEATEFSEALCCDRFVMLPCTIGGRAFVVAKQAEDRRWLPPSMRGTDGAAVAWGNVLVLGYSEDGHRSLSDEEVIHIERCITMTIELKDASRKTHYIIENVILVKVEDDGRL